MKVIAITTVMLAFAASTFGQGVINFNNRVTGVGGVVAPIYGVNPAAQTVQMRGNATTNGGAVNYTGVPLISGTGFTATLWAAPSGTLEGAGAFTQYGSTKMRTLASTPGFIEPQPLGAAIVIPVSLVPANSTLIAYQVRAWDNQNNTITTWAAALGGGFAYGSSAVFEVSTSTAGSPPPANLVGLTSFNLINPVPEPSLIALGALGLGALLLRRRKA